jgi:membrane fusion protein, multidrug efflux system
MRKAALFPGFLWLLSAVLLTTGCSREKQHQPVEPSVVTGVMVEQVAAAPFSDHFLAPGTVRAAVAAQMAARLAGTIDAVHVHDGERVTRGRLLISIRSEETVSGASGASAAVEEAARGVEEAEARQKLAEDTFKRFETLYKEQAVTLQELDVRRTERDVAVQGVSRAESRLVQAREQFKAAGALAGYTRITAPFSGIITGKTAERGATVFPGTLLLTVEEEGLYRFEAAVPDLLSAKLKVGETVTVMVDGLDDEITGRVAEVAAVADPVTRTRLIKVDLQHKGLRSGMFGRASIPAGSGKGISIPASAVVERGMLTSVWVVGDDSIARMRLVKTGRRLGERVELLSGLSEGERVVTGGVAKVVEGARVK